MKIVESKKLENSRHELTISVGAEEFKAAVDKAFKQNAKKITIPGFRKGKAPRSVIEKLYGEGVFYEDAINALYPEAYDAAIDEADLEPVDRADIEVLEAGAEGFTFKATFTVKPEVSVKDYKGLKAEKVVPEVTDEEVENELKRMREQNGRMVDITDRAAENGDTANIDFEGFADGKAFEGGKGADYPLILGSGAFIPGFEEQIVGKKIGEEFDVNVTFPAEYGEKSLAGKEAVFKCKLNSLKIRELPELDDEYVKDVSEFNTVDELKADITAKIKEAKESHAVADMDNSLVTSVIANLEGEIPEVMIDNECNQMVQDFGYRLQSQGLDLQQYFKYTNSNVEMMKASFAEQATRQVKVRLALEKIAEVENITVSDDEINAELEKIAKEYNMEAEKIKGMISVKDLAKDLKVHKAIDLVRDTAVITEITEAEKIAREAADAVEKAAKKPAKKAAAKKPAAKKTAKKDEAAE